MSDPKGQDDDDLGDRLYALALDIVNEVTKPPQTVDNVPIAPVSVETKLAALKTAGTFWHLLRKGTPADKTNAWEAYASRIGLGNGAGRDSDEEVDDGAE